MRATSSHGTHEFRARSRSLPVSRDHNVSFDIVGSETPAARRTFLLGSIESRTQSTPAKVQIVKLD